MQEKLKQMSLLEGSLANRCHKVEKEREKKMIVGSGMRCLELYKIVNPDGSLEKMCRALLTLTMGIYSRNCALTWKTTTTKYNRLLFRLVPKMHHTEETEFGLLPTPTTQDTEHPNMILNEKGRREPTKGKSSHSLNLADRVKMMWPTPNAWDGQRGPRSEKHLQENKGSQTTLVTAVAHNQRMFPTPTQDIVTDRTKKYSQGGTPLTLAIKDPTQKVEGNLNYEWVTWLMGYPKNYLDISEKNQKEFQELPQTKKKDPKS